MKEKKTGYKAFLLRLWREDNSTPWRATLQDAHSGAQYGFADLEALCAFLEQQPGDEELGLSVLLKGDKAMSSTILQINFKFNVPRSAYEEAVSPLAEPIAAVPGLQWKVWLMNEVKSEAGGILCFDDQNTLQTYLDGPIATQIANHPALSDMNVKLFDVLGEATAVNRGPVKMSASA